MLDERFRALKQTRPPDLWPDIEGREPRPPRREIPWGRLGTAALALVVAAAGLAVVGRAFLGEDRGRSTATTLTGKIAFMAHVEKPQGITTFDLCLLELQGGEKECLIRDLIGYSDPEWSPDGSELAFLRPTSRGDGDLYLINADGTGLRRVLENWPGIELTWSPDGTRFAYYSQKDGDIHVMNVDGSSDQRITQSTATTSPAWSPNGSLIAFEARDKDAVFVVHPDGSGLRQLTQGGAWDLEWSPSGDKIAFARNSDIYTMQADGSEIVRLTNDSAAEASPTWSPDGRQLAFSREFGGRSQIFLMNADGTEERQVTQEPEGAAQPSWQPVVSSDSDPTEHQAPACPIEVAFAVAAPADDPSSVRLVVGDNTPVVSALDGVVSSVEASEESGWAEVAVRSTDVVLTYRFYLDSARGSLPGEGAEVASGDVIGGAHEFLRIEAQTAGGSESQDVPAMLRAWGCREGLPQTDILRARLLDGSMWEIQLARPIEVVGAQGAATYGELTVDGQVVAGASRIGERPDFSRPFEPGFDPPVLIEEFEMPDGRRAQHWNMAPSHENDTFDYVLWVEGPGEHMYFYSAQPIADAELVVRSLRMSEADRRIDAIWFASERVDVVKLEAAFFLIDPQAPMRGPEVRLNAACRVGHDPVPDCQEAELEVPAYTPGTEEALRGATIKRVGA